MKIWHTVLLLVALVALVGVGWLVHSSGSKADKAESRQVLRSRMIREQNRQAKAAKRFERRIDVKGTVGGSKQASKAKVDKESNPLKDWDPFKDEDFGNLTVDLEGESDVPLSEAVRRVLAGIENAQAKFDRKAVLASVQQLLRMIAKGEQVSVAAKRQAIEALKFCGGGAEALPELVELMADQDISTSTAAMEALQEMLWDFDTTPQQIASALKQMVKLTTDQGLIEPFVFEMAEMPVELKVDTALALLDSGNEAAIGALSDNMAFVFDDFDGRIQTREDIVQYGKDHAGEVSKTSLTGK